jgi:hypothetical protein
VSVEQIKAGLDTTPLGFVCLLGRRDETTCSTAGRQADFWLVVKEKARLVPVCVCVFGLIIKSVLVLYVCLLFPAVAFDMI